jgi:hypothetical protein
VIANAQKTGEIERTVGALRHLAAHRFLWALPLNALQNAVVDKIQVVRIKTAQGIVAIPGSRASTNAQNVVIPARPSEKVERVSMTIQARDFGDPPAADQFIENMAAEPYFKEHLRKVDPIRLKDRSPAQVTQTDPPRSYIPFTIECDYLERPL